MRNIWECKIGSDSGDWKVPGKYDFPMREAVRQAFLEITGIESSFIFSGWGASLNKEELSVVTWLPASAVEAGIECAWVETDYGIWESSCGHALEFGGGVPVEDDAKFCCYCGKRLAKKMQK